MGCDIHCFYELGSRPYDKCSQGVKYFYSFEFNVWRDYSLFGVFAGVRIDDIPGSYEPKGFPEDACEETKKAFDDWGLDAHTPSWLSLKELKEIDWDEKELEGSRYFRDIIIPFLEYQSYSLDLRIVFWFDN